MTARRIIVAWMGLVMMLGCNPGWANALDQSSVPFRWENWDVSDRGFLEEQRGVLMKSGAEVGLVEKTKPKVKSLSAVALVLVGTAAVSVLAETIVNGVKKWNQCGVIVDLRNEEAITTKKSCDLGIGDILTIPKNGEVKMIRGLEPPSLAIETLKVILGGWVPGKTLR